MTLTITLTVEEEARLHAAAQREGIDPAELVHQLVRAHLPSTHVAIDCDRLPPAQQRDSLQEARHDNACSAGRCRMDTGCYAIEAQQSSRIVKFFAERKIDCF